MSKVYSTIRLLDASSNGIGERLIKSSLDFLEKYSFVGDEAANQFDNTLLKLTIDNPADYLPLLCLRCRISHPIAYKVQELFFKHGKQNDLDLADMASYVLNDDGSRYLKIQLDQDDNSDESKSKLFGWNLVQDLIGEQRLPFGLEVLNSYKEQLSNLDTWAKLKVKGNAELKSYFKNHGLLLISPWALLADSSQKRVEEASLFTGYKIKQIREILQLHKSYLTLYREAKQKYKQLTKKNYGWEPDKNFLASLNPPQQDCEKLLLIEKSIRSYLTKFTFCRNLEREEEENLMDPKFLEEDENVYELIMQSLKRAALPVLEKTINDDRPKWSEKTDRRKAWDLYAQGLSQRDIAIKCGHGQAWVSKLIKQDDNSELIVQEAAIELIRRAQFRPLALDPNGPDRLCNSLKNHIIEPEQEGSKAFIRDWVFEILNK